MIFLGSATLLGNKVQIPSPIGFDSVNGVRITNYTGDVLILTGISGEDASQQYLMPLQQMVYKTENVSRVPTVTGVALGNAISTPNVFVEWTDDMLNDFIGTYPVSVTQIDQIQTPGFATVNVLSLPATGTTYAIPANPARQSITIVNDGPTNIEWSTADSAWGTHPVIVPGSGRTLDSTTGLFFRTSAVNGVLEWYED